jgi:hypothetical protein
MEERTVSPFFMVQPGFQQSHQISADGSSMLQILACAVDQTCSCLGDPNCWQALSHGVQSSLHASKASVPSQCDSGDQMQRGLSWTVHDAVDHDVKVYSKRLEG